MHTLMEQHIPTSKFRKTVRQPKHINRLAKQKNNLYQKQKLNKDLKSDYVKLSKQYDKAVALWYDAVENKICQDRNSRSFYKYTNKKMKSFSSIPSLISKTGKLETTDKGKANLLNEAFQDILISDNGKSLNLTNG